MPRRSAIGGASGAARARTSAAAARRSPQRRAPASLQPVPCSPRGRLRRARTRRPRAGPRSAGRAAAGCEGALERAPELAARRRDLGEAEAAKRLVVAADVPASPAVRDRRAAAHQRLEHRQAAGRVHERVGGGEPVGHASVNPSTRTRGSLPNVRDERSRSSRCGRTGRRPASTPSTCSASAIAPSTSPTPQPPPETSTTPPASQAGRAARARLAGRHGTRNSGSVNP